MKVCLVTVSTECKNGSREDTTGPGVEKVVRESLAASVLDRCVVKNDHEQLVQVLRKCVNDEFDLVLTLGGTGFTARDITPEATKRVIHREAPGLVYAMVVGSLKVTPMAALSRPAAGIADKTIIVNLPGSLRGAVESFGFIKDVLTHGTQLVNGVNTKSHPERTPSGGVTASDQNHHQHHKHHHHHHHSPDKHVAKKAKTAQVDAIFVQDVASRAVVKETKMGKSTLFQSADGSFMVGLNACKPGQSHALHSHDDMDKVYAVVQGQGVFLVEGEKELACKPGQMLIAPAGAKHGIKNTSPTENFVLLTTMNFHSKKS